MTTLSALGPPEKYTNEFAQTFGEFRAESEAQGWPVQNPESIYVLKKENVMLLTGTLK